MKKYEKAMERIDQTFALEESAGDEHIIQIDGGVFIEPYLSHDDFLV